ncbi:2,3-dihydro-2,3-dihydroxybenzoate dehydrogenase [Enhygromyxa salina]|uniref:2,3-dihydro-2,3-dihydroxybenzoate dehydrogenase n=2 Tax=Enhygromyxa salina TaxID=215803 RepID=A0A2S9XDH8_9BACT|nr:2,3-dihydro-2,3-dihydroxybenzoate dehydrogenase [Enhygromyxa salina]
MSGKTVLITGGNSGIGSFTAVGLARMGARVVFTSRNPRKGDVARAELREAAETKSIDYMALDLASFTSIAAFADQYLAKYDRLDVLILNAGVILDARTETKEGFETTFGVNHLGHFYLTQLLRERLEASAPARVVVVASDAYRGAREGLDFDDLMATRDYKPLRAYAHSKLANILFTNELARQLEGKGVTANSLHPGVVRTGLGRDGDVRSLLGRVALSVMRPFLISPERGARTSIYLASSPEVEGESGGYYVSCRPAKRIAPATDEGAARRLWQVSEELVAEGKATAKAKARRPS